MIGTFGRLLPELGAVRDSLLGPSALFAWTPDAASLNWLAYLLVHRTLPPLPEPAPAEPAPDLVHACLALAAAPPAPFPAPLAPLAASIALRVLCHGANWPRAPPLVRCLALALVLAAPAAGLNPALLSEQLLCVGSGLHRLLAAPLPPAFLHAFLARRPDHWAAELRLPDVPGAYPGAPHPLRTGARDLYETCQAVVALAAGAEPPALAALAARPHVPRAAFAAYLLHADALRPDVLAAALAASPLPPAPPDPVPSVAAALVAAAAAHAPLWPRLGSALGGRPDDARLRAVLSHSVLAALLLAPAAFAALLAGLRAAASVPASAPDFASVAALALAPHAPATARAWLALAKHMLGTLGPLQAIVPLRFLFLHLWDDAPLRAAMQRDEHEWFGRVASSLGSGELAHTYRALSLFAQPLCPGNGDLLAHGPLLALLRPLSLLTDAHYAASAAAPHAPRANAPSVPVIQAGSAAAAVPAPGAPPGPAAAPADGAGTLVLSAPLPPLSEDLAAEMSRAAAAHAALSAALAAVEDGAASQQRVQALLGVCRQTSAHLLAAQQQEEERAAAVAALYALEEARVEERVRCPRGDCSGARLFVPRLRPVQRPASAHLLAAYRPARVRLLALCASASEAVASALALEEVRDTHTTTTVSHSPRSRSSAPWRPRRGRRAWRRWRRRCCAWWT